MIHRDLRVRRSWRGRSPIQWHSDQSPEPQPPGTTFIGMLESPAAAGGDTLVSSTVAAYKALSPRFRKRLEGLTAIHTNNDGVTQELKNKDAVMRRSELVNEHPIVIVHPVTKEKALYVNSVYTKRIGELRLLFEIRSTEKIFADSFMLSSRLRPGGVGLHPQLPL